MRFLIKLASRNLLRQKRRTILTMMAIAVGLIALIMVDSIYMGFDNQSFANLKSLETGDIKVHKEGYFTKKDELPIDMTIDYSDVVAAVKQVDGVEAAAPRLVFAGRLNNGIDEIPVMAVGIDPQSDPGIFALPKYTDGKLPAAGAYEAAVGIDLAKIMDLRIGDYFTLVTKTKDEAFQALDFTVVGLVSSPHPQVNNNSVYVPLDIAAPGLAIDGQATEVALHIAKGFNINRVAQDVENQLSGIRAEALTWREVAAEFLAIGESKKSFLSLMLFFIVLIASVGVINTILLGAMERKREIGMMKAMGMTEKEIVRTFMFEAAAIGVLASVVGCVVAILSNIYMVVVGINFGSMYGDLDIGYPISGVVHGGWHWSMIGIAFISGIVVCVIASYIPAKRAALNDPIKSLRQA